MYAGAVGAAYSQTRHVVDCSCERELRAVMHCQSFHELEAIDRFRQHSEALALPYIQLFQVFEIADG